jgi:hypothetical protein
MARYTRTWFLLAAIAVALVPGSCADDSTTTSDAESAGTPVDEPTLVSRGLEVAADGDGVRLSGGGASLRLRSVLPVELGAFEAAGDSLSRSNADGFGELWDAVGSGVRQSWYFPNDPSPGDDLVVTIEIEEGRALARTREGTIIGSKETGPFAYSDALWIGADGQQTPIRAAYLDSSIELRVPATVVEDTEFPAWLDPTVSAPLDPFVPVPTLTIVFPLQPSISCNASRCRIGFDLDESSGNVNFERRAMVVDTNGLVQTPISSLVATGLTNNVTASEARRSIANIGSTFLVVWREGTSTVRAQRFTETGAPLDATSFVVGTDACNCSTGGPSVTASDTSFMVAWGTTSTGLKGRLIDVNGQFASSVVEILAPTTNGLSTAPEVASDGNGFAIGFDNANTGARIITTSPTLALTANTFLGPSSHFGGARVAWDGTSYVVGWLNASNAWVRRVSSIGAPLAPASDLGPAGAIRLACRTGDCLVTMYSSNNLLGQPLLTGVPAGGPIVITPLSNYMAHDITTNGSDYQLLWYTGNLRMSPVTLQGVLEIPGGAPVEYVGNNLGGFVTTTPAGNLALARTGSTCVSAFISANGVPGPEATLAGSCSIAPVGLLEEGSDAFLHSDGVSTRILDATASPVTPMVGTTDPGELGSDAYWNGGDFMLLNDASGAQTALKRFSTAGQLVGGTVLFPGTSPRGTGTPAGGLVTAIVSGNQTIRAVDPTGVVVSPVTALGASTVAGDVAWGSVNGGVTWASSTSVLFQRIDQAAVPLDAFAFTVASTQTAPRIAWDGNGYVVAYRSPTTNAIRARRMKADGTADGGDFSVAIPRSTFLGVVAVPGAPSARAAVYSSGNRPELHASRLILAYVDSDAIDGTPCAGNASCQSGLCVDGVCCAAACGGGVDDCQACSVASGGQLDGQCTPLAAPATMVCRASAGVCDVPETCAAASTTCPADTFAPSSVECRASSNVCDAAESCTGASAACPADGYLAAGVECRPASDVCDAAESCTGASAACPADGYVAGGSNAGPPAISVTPQSHAQA